ncbi:STAS domain-containing protein [Nannocystis radixulma]|uniref:STAS domain-containing protein n=1 Tax=Nannocystis radixulma TaxID=2995305 RepID=A0ABT5BIC4_9BACT|nr:STAS domain-containing protein [Nannocystis radixulma]MDC0672787.1 STAS domain-containing protein [Nannocystis radixulma]
MDERTSGPEEASATELAEDWSVLLAVTEQLNAATVREATLQAFLLPAPQREDAEVALCTIDPDAAGNPEWLTVAVVRPPAVRKSRARVGDRYHLPDIPFSRLYLEQPGVPVLVGSVATDPRLDPVLRDIWAAAGIKAALLIALTLRGRVVGLFSVQWSCEVQLGPREQRIYQILSRNAALLLENMVIVDRLQTALAERSTPLIPITDDILVMPLIGTLDESRRSRILEVALQGSRSSAARVTIIDITGVPSLDVHAAALLTSAADALRLLGVLPVLSGVRPEVARTLADLGNSLTGVVTCGTLQAGVEYALRQLGK